MIEQEIDDSNVGKERENIPVAKDNKADPIVREQGIKQYHTNVTQKLRVKMDGAFRRLREEDTPIDPEVDGKNEREQKGDSQEVDDKEADPIVREQAEAKLEVEAEERNGVAEVGKCNTNVIQKTAVKRDGAFRRLWERASSITQIICRDPLQIDLGSRMDQHKAKTIRLICEIVVVAIAFTTSLQWTLGKIGRRVVFDPGGTHAKVLARNGLKRS